MRVSRRRTLGLAIPLLVLFSLPARSQNLLVNPGFDKDLSGWTVTTSITPDPSPGPGYVEASAGWVTNDRSGSSSSGGTSFHARAFTMSYATSSASQCIPLPAGTVASFGAQILTTRQYVTASAEVSVTFFAAAACSGSALASASASSLTTSVLPQESTSGGLWLPAAGLAVVPAAARSVRFAVGARATGTMAYGLAYVDAIADDATFSVAPAQETISLLPSAAWVHGAGGAYWSTNMSLVNPGVSDAAVALKWLGHDMDGRGGSERAYLVTAGQTLALSDEEWEINHSQNYGAILMTSSSPSVFLQSETSTYVAGGGTVGQALGALGEADFAGATPKALAPIRESASFRTNLVLANPTEVPVTAHVVLFAADGTQIGAQDVALPPLGMTQLSRVAALLGAPTLDLGRLSVSTATPGGLVAAYASVIDNVTNDPRTLLPR